MQRDREIDPELGAAPADHRDHPRGRQCDFAPRDRQTFRIHDDLQGSRDILVIVERLAHSHQDDVRHLPLVLGRRPFAERIPRDHDLSDNLLGREIAHQPLCAGVAEGAGQGAADLGGDAQGPAIILGDMYGLDLLAIGKAQEPFAGSIDRGKRARNHRPLQHVARRELVAERLRQRGHRREIGGAPTIDPVPELARAERFSAEFGHFGGERLAAQPDEVAARRFGYGLGRHASPHMGSRAAQRFTSQALSISASAWAKPASE